jgi:protein-disulfide isomerase
MIRPFALLAAIAFSAPAIAAPAPRAAAAAPAWINRIAVTPAGSYVRGNPAAKVKLVEYSSFTCSHCAAFQSEAKPELTRLIASGQVSLEIRNAVRDRYDLAAALLARCQGPASYFRAADAVFAAQDQWLAKAATVPDPAPTTPIGEVLVSGARAVGLDRITAPGLPPAKVAQCIASPAEQARLAKMRDEAWNQRQISGTPFFLINGQPATDTYGWADLAPKLRAALK